MAPRVLVVGAGALGSVYGAAMARAGADVQLLARRAHAEAIAAAGGVTVEGLGGTSLVPLRGIAEPAAAEPADVVVVMTKSHDTARALAGLDHVRAGVEVAVSFQNGVEKDALLAAWCGAERVVGGMSMVGATLSEPGTVAHTLDGTTYVGELGGGTSDRVRALAGLLERGGMPVVTTERIVSAEWSKLVHAAPTMTITALPRLSFHRALLDPSLASVYMDSLHEGAAVASAAGGELDDWPGMFPVRTLVGLAPERAVEAVHERGRQMEAAGATDVRVSMLADIEAGRPLEVGAVHGFLVQEAERLGVDVPVTRAALDLFLAIDAVRA
jgi:2-dehydropantoate 2-reductase